MQLWVHKTEKFSFLWTTVLLIHMTHHFSEISRVVHYPANCTSVLQPLDLGIIRWFKQVYREHLVQTAVCLMDASIDQKKEDGHPRSCILHYGSLVASNAADHRNLFLKIWLWAWTPLTLVMSH
jgi:hypothetical protein